MVTDTFFDLQRFADDTLVGGASGFTWAGGKSFAGSGTAADPAYMAATGASIIEGTSIYLKGTTDGYNFVIQQNEGLWEIAKIDGEDNIIRGDFSDDSGAYSLYGDVDVKVIAGSDGLVETVNGAAVYVKANTEDTTFNINSHEGDDAFIYTFSDGVKGVAVGLDDDDVAYFEGSGTDIVFRAGTASSAKDLEAIGFEKTASVFSDGAEVVSVYSGSNTFTVYGTKFVATAASASAPVILTSEDKITGVSEVVADGEVELNVNGEAWSVVGEGVDSVTFGSAADSVYVNVNDSGVVSVSSDEGNVATVDKLTTDGIVANGAVVKSAGSSAYGAATVTLDSVGAGFTDIELNNVTGFVKIGDNDFVVNDDYTIKTSASDITFMPDDTAIVVIADKDEAYTVDGVDGIYAFADSLKASATGVVSINGAEVSITNNQSAIAAPAITSDDDKEGVDEITGLKANDVVNVENDGDGYTAVFNAAEGDEGTVVLTANDAVVSLDASDMDESAVSIVADSDGTAVSVKGLEAYTTMTLEGGDEGVTYQITDNSASNEVDVAAGKTVIVELDSKKNVADVYSADAIQNYEQLEAKWEEVATIGGHTDRDSSHYGDAEWQFYHLNGLSEAQLGFDDDDDDEPTTVSSVINIVGQGPKGTEKALGEAEHVTLTVGNGDNAGAVPVNIAHDENDSVVDVTVDMTNAKYPSTVAVGTSDASVVTASHKIYLSNTGSSNNPNYAYLGENATGQNLVQAGNGAAMLRHDGDNRTSVLGGAGDDSIQPDSNDIVYGGGGADVFFDDASYEIQDYSATEGDAIVATRFDSLDEVGYGNISGTGNKVQFGTGNTLTLANQKDAAAAVHVKVAVLDVNGNVSSGTCDVVLANSAVAVDASAASLNGALIIADSLRGNHANYITGSAGSDVIYAGANDSIDGGAGNDDITINDGGTGVVVGLSDDGGDDTVRGWEFGFDRSAGHTQLYLGGAKFEGTTQEGQLVVTTEDGSSITIEDPLGLTAYPILVDDKKYMILGSSCTVAIYSNDYLADTYFAAADGGVIFTEDVTEDLGLIVIGDDEDYENIRYLGLFNNGTASVVGTAARETVELGGEVAYNSGKAVSLAGGNDVIVSAGDDGPSNVFFFSTGDGRDTIRSFGHYLGVEKDPDKQMADVLVIEGFTGLEVNKYTDGTDRIVFNTSEQDDVVIYEEDGLDPNNKMYLVKVDGADVGVAKIGYTESVTSGVTGNNFTYAKEVNYYIGTDVAARDTLTIGDDVDNVEVWLDGTAEGNTQFYRGIGVINASLATATEMTLVGSMDDNTIIGGSTGSSDILWGGAGDNLLVGGAGEDIFLYCKDSRDYIDGAEELGEANHDTISGYDADNDTIYLGDITLNDIDLDAMAESSDGGITDSTVTIQFKNGGSLTVTGTQEETKFNTADGNVYTATRSTNSWS